MKNIYLLSVCQKLRRLEDYRNDWDEKEKEIKEVFCGDSWIEALEDTIRDLGDDFLNQIKEQGKTMDNIEQSELINLIEKFDLKNKILTRAFDSKEKAEDELHEIMKKADEGCENYTLVESSSDFDRLIHNDFLDVVFNNIRFSPYRGYWRIIYCYDAQTGIELGSIPDNKKWDVWFNKIKNINSETFKEVVSMIEEPGPCLGD